MTGPERDQTNGEPPGGSPALAVVVPLHNEADALPALIAEIRAALAAGPGAEIVAVDDGSTDGTRDALARLSRAPGATLRIVVHRRRAGQSAALASGIAAARAPLIATIDGDGQNDPADIPRLTAAFAGETQRTGGPLLIAGRRRRRRDSWAKRAASRIANGVRGRLLGDRTADTGCGLKVFRRDAFLALPRFDHMHRFLPALIGAQGGRVVSVDVNHRPRLRGQSKYGVLDRLWVGLADLVGVMWLMRRPLGAEANEWTAGADAPAGEEQGEHRP